jgi:predicted amidohydrolase YtcJ
MTKRILILFVALFAFATVHAQKRSADTIFVNANVYTANDKQPTAAAIAVKDGRIIYVGDKGGAGAFRGSKTKEVDLQGATVLPGMTDSHYHLFGVGEREVTLNLEGTTSLEDFLAKVKARVDATPKGKWVTGRGWIETFWKPQAFPTRYDLDRISPDNPVYLVRADGHGAVANSLALKLSGITRDTQNPFGGEIVRDRSSGEATGMLLDAAHGLVTKNIPPETQADIDRAVLLGVERSIKLGWTEVQNAGSVHDDIVTMRRLFDAGKIKLRIYNAVYGPGPNADRLLQEGPAIGAYGGRFTMRTIKVVSDGALGSRSAALLQPYSDSPDTSGFMTVKLEELQPMLEKALRLGVQVETHAIGDRANHIILDAYERAFAAVPRDQRKIAEPRWRIEHAQILASDDIGRFSKLGVIASMQPSHAIGDLFFAPARLGFQRLDGAYAWEELLQSGAMVIGGSDAPVERGEPMIEFYAAVARKSQKGFTGQGWHPEQAVTREQALKMFTLWPAFAAFQEKERGSIETGKLADLTILSNDVMKVPEPDILKTKCVMTVINGEIVYDGRSK